MADISPQVRETKVDTLRQTDWVVSYNLVDETCVYSLVSVSVSVSCSVLCVF